MYGLRIVVKFTSPERVLRAQGHLADLWLRLDSQSTKLGITAGAQVLVDRVGKRYWFTSQKTNANQGLVTNQV